MPACSMGRAFLLSADDSLEDADTRSTQGPPAAQWYKKGRLSGILYLACVCHVVAAASLQVSNAPDPESPRVASESVSGQVFEHDENCAAVSHAVV